MLRRFGAVSSCARRFFMAKFLANAPVTVEEKDAEAGAGGAAEDPALPFEEEEDRLRRMSRRGPTGAAVVLADAPAGVSAGLWTGESDSSSSSEARASSARIAN